jgi:hypothetical protein
LVFADVQKKELKHSSVTAIKRLMNLDEGQRKKVSEWINQGLKISDIQGRIASELGVKLTYMDVRFLVDDLKLMPKDPEPAKSVSATLQASSSAAPLPSATSKPPPKTEGDAPKTGGSVSVQIDKIARPGAVVSGKVTFSDGNGAEWYFDQMGRLGLVPQTPGYRPPAADLREFQSLLDAELSKMGF